MTEENRICPECGHSLAQQQIISDYANMNGIDGGMLLEIMVILTGSLMKSLENKKEPPHDA